MRIIQEGFQGVYFYITMRQEVVIAKKQIETIRNCDFNLHTLFKIISMYEAYKVMNSDNSTTTM
jgi:hypothetical protein